jgi:hypothetical protein
MKKILLASLMLAASSAFAAAPSSVKLNEATYPEVTAPTTKSRAQVQAELAKFKADKGAVAAQNSLYFGD